MKRELLLAEFMSQPWALERSRMQAFSSVMRRWAVGEAASPEILASVRADSQSKAVREVRGRQKGGKSIAVLPLVGVISQRANMVNDVSGGGGVSTQIFTSALRQVLADETIGHIVLDIDSPGGSVAGVAELAAEIFASRSTKPVIAVANSLAASAAYWIASCCNEVYCTPGGQVGSIGVIAAHEDMSAAYEDAGIKTTLITAGKFKGEGNPFGPLDDEALQNTQEMIDYYYGMFTNDVARGRGVRVDSVRNGMGQGRVLTAPDALANKMVDGIATIDQVIQQLATNNGTAALRAGTPRRPALSAARLELDHMIASTPDIQAARVANARRRRELDMLSW